jgi:hypothetical protein
LSSEVLKQRYKRPHKNTSSGSALYKRPWRSAQCAALKLKFSSLVRILLTSFSPSGAWFCKEKKYQEGKLRWLPSCSKHNNLIQLLYIRSSKASFGNAVYNRLHRSKNIIRTSMY